MSSGNTLAPVSADLHPQTHSPSSPSLVLRATTAPSAAPRAFMEPTAPRPAPARTTSPARTSTASASAKKVSSALWPGDLQHSDVSDSDGAHSGKNDNNNSEVKLRHTMEVVAVDVQGLMLSCYCSLWIPTTRVIPVLATRQLYFSNIAVELFPHSRNIWDNLRQFWQVEINFSCISSWINTLFPHNDKCFHMALFGLNSQSQSKVLLNEFHHCLFQQMKSACDIPKTCIKKKKKNHAGWETWKKLSYQSECTAIWVTAQKSCTFMGWYFLQHYRHSSSRW